MIFIYYILYFPQWGPASSIICSLLSSSWLSSSVHQFSGIQHTPPARQCFPSVHCSRRKGYPGCKNHQPENHQGKGYKDGSKPIMTIFEGNNTQSTNHSWVPSGYQGFDPYTDNHCNGGCSTARWKTTIFSAGSWSHQIHPFVGPCKSTPSYWVIWDIHLILPHGIRKWYILQNEVECSVYLKHILLVYELQPKFRLMESSIRNIYFLEIELGLGKR